MTVARALGAYATILKDSQTLGYLACVGLAFVGMIAFVTNSAIVFTGHFGLEPYQFGFCFSFVMAGGSIGSYLNSRLVDRRGISSMIGIGTVILAAGGTAVLVTSAMDAGLMPTLLSLLLYVFGVGFVFANSVARTMSRFRENSGAASSLFGVNQFLIGSIVAAALSLVATPTPMPLASAMAFAGLGAAAVWWGLAEARFDRDPVSCQARDARRRALLQLEQLPRVVAAILAGPLSFGCGYRARLVRSRVMAQDAPDAPRAGCSMSTESLAPTELTIAVFADFENLALGAEESNQGRFDMDLVLKRILERGRIVFKRAYCDWSRFQKFSREFHASGFRDDRHPALVGQRQEQRRYPDGRRRARPVLFEVAHRHVRPADRRQRFLAAGLQTQGERQAGHGLRRAQFDFGPARLEL